MSTMNTLPVAVIGAGPIGLAAGARLLERGLTPLILEAGASAGANLRTFAHVQLFSPWRYDVDEACVRLLSETGWTMSQPDALPTAGEFIDQYLQPLVSDTRLASHVRLSHRVVAIARANVDKLKTLNREESPFVLRASTPSGEQEIYARAVIDASGTWGQPNPLGANGLPALGEASLRERIAYGMPDILGANRSRYARKRVLVVGAGHSAAGNLLALAQLADIESQTQIVWAIRGENFAKIFGGGAADGLPARGALGLRLKALREAGRIEVHADFLIHRIESIRGKITVYPVHGSSASPIEGIDEIICSTGSRPNLAMTQELRLKLDPALETTEALAPLIDPNEHSCGTVRPHGHRELAHPEHGYYAVGARSYGRAPTFLLVTGYEQARSVVAALAGDIASADEAQLVLPETGVCSTDFVDAGLSGCGSNCAPPPTGLAVSTQASGSQKESASCCGGAAKLNADACCVADEEAKAIGESGCRCSSPKAAASEKTSSSCCA
ncbi:MAG TPA: NAD(P)-binding domain-containing protein [Steroidobacter sp.]|jgi:hypothetical protein